jgi:hypothetical protein
VAHPSSWSNLYGCSKVECDISCSKNLTTPIPIDAISVVLSYAQTDFGLYMCNSAMRPLCATAGVGE